MIHPTDMTVPCLDARAQQSGYLGYPRYNVYNPQNRVFLTEPVFVTETRYCNTKTVYDRNKFPSQKKGNVTKTRFFQTKISVKKKIPLGNKFPSEKQFSV